MDRADPASPLAAAWTDEDLARAVREGSAAGFEALYARYFRRVYQFALSRTRDPLDAEDLTQETFLSLIQALPSFEGRAAFAAWVLGIARNTVHSHIRRRQTRERREVLDPHSLEPGSLDALDPEHQLVLTRAIEAVDDHLEKVQGWQRDVLALRCLEQLPIHEIAERTERSRHAVRASLAKVKALMARELGTS